MQQRADPSKVTRAEVAARTTDSVMALSALSKAVAKASSKMEEHIVQEIRAVKAESTKASAAASAAAAAVSR